MPPRRHILTEEQLATEIEEAGDKLVLLVFYNEAIKPSTFLVKRIDEEAPKIDDVIFITVETGDSGGSGASCEGDWEDMVEHYLDLGEIPTIVAFKNATKTGETSDVQVAGADDFSTDWDKVLRFIKEMQETE